jgi:endoglucanase
MQIVKTMQLTNQWVVVIINSMQDVVNEIGRLSGSSTYLNNVNLWASTRYTATPNYNARNAFRTVRDQYIAQARINVGEQALDDATSFTPNPLEQGRVLVGINEDITTGGPLVEYVHYCYLKVPLDTTSISVFGQTTSVILNDDQISRAIKINQVGYLPSSPKKYAYIGAHIYDHGPLTIDATSFTIHDSSSNATVYTGSVTLRDSNTILASGKPLTGENVYQMDLSDFSGIGEFYIKVPGVGRSWNFKHTLDVYGEVFYTTTRGLYHQRCGLPLKAPYTNWLRPTCHTKPVKESKFVSFPSQFTDRPANYERFDVYGATTDHSSFNVTAAGGWHDAADWDRNTQHYTCVFDLLYAYEMDPDKFTSNQLNIPESPTAYPDILKEAEYGLQCWKRSMDSRGGVSGMIETNTHPTRGVDGNYAYSVRTRWDSLLLAAAAAMMAELIAPFDMAKSNTWKWYAIKSYNFGNNPANSLGTVTIPAKTNRGLGTSYTYTFTEKDTHIEPLLAHAKSRLYKLTSDSTYLTGLDTLIGKLRAPFKWPYTNRDYSGWINYSCLDHVSNPTTKANYIKLWFTNYADALLPHVAAQPYRCTWPVTKDFWLDWGASCMTNENRSLLLSYKLTTQSKYLEAAILNMDYMLGANPQGMVYTTGLGQSYPAILQHETSQFDGIDDPVPGIALYGQTGGSHNTLRTTVWQSPSPTGQVEFKTPVVPLWRSWSAHPTLNTRQCEFTIQETMSCNIFSAAALMSEGWSPSNTLKTKTPKTLANLPGYYYLP